MRQEAGDRVSRLRDRPPGGEGIEARAAALMRGLQPCEEPSELQLEQIEESLSACSSPRTRPSLTLRMVFVALTLVAGVATVKAYELARRAGWLARTDPVSAAAPARTQPSKQPVRATSAARLPPVAFPDRAPVARDSVGPTSDATSAVTSANATRSAHVLAPQTVTSQSSRRLARASHSVAAVGAPAYAPVPRAERRDAFEPAPTIPSTGRIVEGQGPRALGATPAQESAAVVPLSAPSQEIHALDRALILLRRDHDAPAALTALDAYLDRYPHGVLHREARLARLDALLILRRTDEALAELETLPLDSGRRSTELQVVRAELRARTDCSRAEEDFSVALTHSPDATLLERILYGRGACRAKLGKAAGAADDLGRYLERFPNGVHAKWTRQWLDTIGKPSAKGG